MQAVDASVRALLSSRQQAHFDDIVSQRVLGASKHIQMIGDMMLDIAAQAEENDQTAEEVIAGVERLTAFFIATRGEASQAVANALRLMTRTLSKSRGQSLGVVRQTLADSIADYRRSMDENLQVIDGCVRQIIQGMSRILLFDYSSTVARIAAIAAESNITLTCYVPESRALNGGAPYICPFAEGGHTVHFIPDSAIYHYLRRSDAAFIGAETFYPDGRAFNTVGSELVGLLCREFGVPYYVITPLIKADMRALHGFQRPPVMLDLTERLEEPLDPRRRGVSVYTCPELVEIPAAYIHAYITEDGILTPANLFTASLNYMRKLEGDK
ncbi:MAG: hypothetical protein FWC72_02695 [Oscillospiraceae bacterium]|nr:hypothetical protein [Oscillospiraceae bacterium]